MKNELALARAQRDAANKAGVGMVLARHRVRVLEAAQCRGCDRPALAPYVNCAACLEERGNA